MMYAGAFMTEAKLEIKERSEGKSELSGREDLPLVCAHLYHDKKDKDYNNPENGLRVTITEELAYHYWHRFESWKIGMDEDANFRTIEGISQNLLNEGMTEQELKDELDRGIGHWADRNMEIYWAKRREEENTRRRNNSYIPPAL